MSRGSSQRPLPISLQQCLSPHAVGLGRPRGTPRTPVRTLISVLEVQVLELKAEVASQKRTIDLLSSVVIASNERVKLVARKLRLGEDMPGGDLSGVLST